MKRSPFRTPARRIEYVRRLATNGGRREITRVGGTNADGTAWNIPLEEAIRQVETGESVFYIDCAGQAWIVGVQADRSGTKHLSTFVRGRKALTTLPEMT